MSIWFGEIPQARNRSTSSDSDAWATKIAQAYELGEMLPGNGARLPKAYDSKGSAHSMARSIKSGKTKAWAKHGKWEAIVRLDPSDASFYVWVQLVDSSTPEVTA
jgi:hypothetical protein